MKGDRSRQGLKALVAVVLALTTLVTLGTVSAMAEGKGSSVGQSVPQPESSRQLPCNVYSVAGAPCVAALSTVRALYAGYDGPLYKVKRLSDGATRNVGVLAPGGLADASVQSAFCSHTTCTITEIYDQSPEGNNLFVEGAGGHGSADIGAPADALPITVGGEEVYGVEISAGMGYRNDQTKGMPVGDEPQGVYMVTSATHVNSGCCFDFGNAEVNNDDNGNGHMDALDFSTECWFTCVGRGPWAQADFENGLFQSDSGGGQGPPYLGTGPLPFVTAMLMNNGRNYFSLEEGDAQSGGLSTEYAGPEPYVSGGGYSPMNQEGAIVLGTGGDDTNLSIGSFFEGVITAGIPPTSANQAVQDNIVSVGYGEPAGSVGSLAPGSEVSLRATSPTNDEEYVGADSNDNKQAIVAPVGPTSSARTKAESTWVVQPGLAKSSCISFEALGDPGAYLVSEDFALHVAPDDGSRNFAGDATYCARTVGGSRGTIFQLYAHPNMYIRNYNEQVYVASDGGANDWDVFLGWSLDTGWAVTVPWTAVGYHKLTIRGDDLCIDSSAGKSPDAPLVQERCGRPGQNTGEAELLPVSGGYGEIRLDSSGDDVAANGKSDAAGVANVVQELPSYSAASLWLAVPQPGGYLKFMNASSGLCLSVYEDTSKPGRKLGQSKCSSSSGTAWQTFSFK